MSYAAIKWTLFLLFFLTLPAMLFMVQVVMFIPAIFFVAGSMYVVPKVFMPGRATESLVFLACLGIHTLIYAGLYYLLSIGVAKAVVLLKTPGARKVAVGVVCGVLGLVTQLSVYGSGGHAPMSWTPLPKVISSIARTYGWGAVAVAYGLPVVLLGTVLCIRKSGFRSVREG